MNEIKVGEIIKVEVVGIQHYGIFIKCLDDESYSGLIHISEISYDFVKDINKVASVGDILYAKVLDVDQTLKHVKLSMKAIKLKNRYKSNYVKPENNEKLSDFSPLGNHLNGWIQEQLKEKRKHD